MDNDTMVTVTPEARKAAADLLDEVSSLLGDTGIGQVADLIRDGEYDEHDATLAFARFERDILARSRSEVGCTIPADHPLAKGLRTSQKALDEIKRQEQANIAGYLAMRDMPIGSVAAVALHQSGRTGAGEAWQPRIGDEVRASESVFARYSEWRDLPLWVSGLTVDHHRPNLGINVTVSEQWPPRDATDGFYIGRDHSPDDLVPFAVLAQSTGAGDKLVFAAIKRGSVVHTGHENHSDIIADIGMQVGDIFGHITAVGGCFVSDIEPDIAALSQSTAGEDGT